MEKKFLFIVFMYILILNMPYLLIIPSTAQHQDFLRILEHRGYYYPTYGYYAVYGVLQNQGSEAVCNVTITVTFLDTQQNEVDIVNGTTLLNVILPGRKSPISIYQLGNLTAKRVESYRLEVTSFKIFTEQKPYGLDLVGVVYYGGIVPGQGPNERPQYLGVAQGEVVNIGSIITNYITVGVVIYDENGMVGVGASDPIIPSKGLLPHKSEQFQAYVSLPLEVAPKIRSYTLVAESPDYTIKDEIVINLSTDDQNPTNNTAFLVVIGILLAIIILFVYRNRSTHKKRRVYIRKKCETFKWYEL
jgi:hypothetical protein